LPSGSVHTAPEGTLVPPASKPAFDFDAAKRSVRQFAKTDAQAENQRVPSLGIPLRGTKERFAYDAEHAVRPDCRTAYQGLGPLAIAALLVDAVRDSGCQW